MTTPENPLMKRGGLPAFDLIQTEHVAPAVRETLKSCAEILEKLEASPTISWQGIMDPLDEIGDALHSTWGPVNHLMGVKNSDALREAHESVLGEVVDFHLRIGQSEILYNAFLELQNSGEWESFEPAQKRIIEQALLSARNSGIGLKGKEQEEFNEIVNELSKLGSKFSNNVLDATKAFSLEVTKAEDMEGLPEGYLALTSGAYNEAHDPESSTPKDGPWKITLDMPGYLPYLQHGKNREIREQLYRAYILRASTGELDNSGLIVEFLKLKARKAKLLGYDTYAELSLSEKMANGVEDVDRLLEDLRKASLKAGEKDMEELTVLARDNGFAAELKNWDVTFWAERLRENLFDYTDEELRPYFPLEKVLGGLFELVERIFDIKVEAADGDTPVWNSDVRYFKVSNKDGGPIATFYLDPYSRPKDKRGGAWMDECVGRRKVEGKIILPTAYLVLNSTPPVEDRPSLLSFSEVETLFHEFGHGLQHMLTTVDFMDASGINGVEWDAVELPSQFMENWCYHRETLLGLTAHYKTGEQLPGEYFDKILKSRTFRAGTMMLRQLKFGMLDMELHHRYKPDSDESVFDVQARMDKLTSSMPQLPEDRFLCSFGHIFSGGYSAGYYSYKWAEVMSADAFAAFEEAGLDDSQQMAETGKRFRDTVLSLGGAIHPTEVFKAFRGREPSAEALLRHSGLK